MDGFDVAMRAPDDVAAESRSPTVADSFGGAPLVACQRMCGSELLVVLLNDRLYARRHPAIRTQRVIYPSSPSRNAPSSDRSPRSGQSQRIGVYPSWWSRGVATTEP